MPRSSEKKPPNSTIPLAEIQSSIIDSSKKVKLPVATATKLTSDANLVMVTESTPITMRMNKNVTATATKSKNHQLLQQLQSIVDNLVSELAREKLTNIQMEQEIRDEIFQEYVHLHKELKRRYSNQKRDDIDDIDSLTDARINLVKQFIDNDQSIDSGPDDVTENRSHSVSGFRAGSGAGIVTDMGTAEVESGMDSVPAVILQNKQQEIDQLRQENERLRSVYEQLQAKFEHLERRKNIDHDQIPKMDHGCQERDGGFMHDPKEKESCAEVERLKKILERKERQIDDLSEMLDEAGVKFQSMEKEISELKKQMTSLKLEKDAVPRSNPKSYSPSKPHYFPKPMSTDSGVRTSSNTKMAMFLNDSYSSILTNSGDTGATFKTAIDTMATTPKSVVVSATAKKSKIDNDVDHSDRNGQAHNRCDHSANHPDRCTISADTRNTRAITKTSKQRRSGNKKKRVSLRINRFRKPIKVRKPFFEVIKPNRAFYLKWRSTPTILHNHDTGSTYGMETPKKHN